MEKIEEFPMLRLLMPWGEYSCAEMDSPADSDDGPIFWVRPGEQVRRFLSFADVDYVALSRVTSLLNSSILVL